MMRTIVQLSNDSAKVNWVFQHDPDTQPPLVEMFEPAFVARMFDVTEENPVPQVGWAVTNLVHDAAGQITAATFSPPLGPTIEDLKARLQERFHAYIYAHYADPDPARLGNWVLTVLAYYKTLRDQLIAGAEWDHLELNFEQFSATDPQVPLETIL